MGTGGDEGGCGGTGGIARLLMTSPTLVGELHFVFEAGFLVFPPRLFLSSVLLKFFSFFEEPFLRVPCVTSAVGVPTSRYPRFKIPAGVLRHWAPEGLGKHAANMGFATAGRFRSARRY